MRKLMLLLALTALVISGCAGSSSSNPAPSAMTVQVNVPTSDNVDTPSVTESASAITLDFSEPLNMATIGGGVKLYRITAAGERIEEPSRIEFDGQMPNRVVLHTLTGDRLTEGEEYALVVGSSIRASRGASLVGDFTGYFATGYSLSLGSNGIEDINDARTAILCISDLHLGDARSLTGGYGWMNANRDALVSFLQEVRQTPFIRELVIDGDMFDEWVAPMDVDPLDGGTQSAYVDAIAAANADIIGAMNDIIRDGLIKVTYVPGNHDMLATSSDIQRNLPGIAEARDARGLGAYSPEGRSEVIIEHGHRYDFYNAPDPISNRAITKSDSLLPPGFFVTKIAVTSGLERRSAVAGMVQARASAMEESQQNYLLYLLAWDAIMSEKPVKEGRDEKIIKTEIDGYTESYAINDLIPYYAVGSSVLGVNLYKGIQDTWFDRQQANHVAVPISAGQAIAGGAVNPILDAQSAGQYFLNPASDKRVVVFGHTHKTTMLHYTNHAKQKSVYANTGTWIDATPGNSDPRMTFAVIIPPKGGGSTTEYVGTYQYAADGTVTRLAHEVITGVQ